MAALNRPTLHIDNILSSQPELGPSIPDGGYGWVIVLLSTFFKAIFPAITVGYGIILLIIRVNTMDTSNTDQYMWDSNFIYVALLFIASQTIFEPLSKKLCNSSTWPKLVIASGTCLTCAGILLIFYIVNWRMNYSKQLGKTFLCILSGILSGVGSSIVLCQIELITTQYFNLKLNAVNTIFNVAQSIGLIMTPILLGHVTLRYGIMQAITWYQTIILQGIVLSIFIKKPNYLKLQKEPYNLIRGISDDEEDIFAKNTTELQSPRTSIQSNSDKIEVSIETSSTALNNTKPLNSNENPNDSQENENHSNDWEVFDENAREIQLESAKTHLNLHKTFATDFNNDLDRIDKFEDNYVEIPKPIFTETYINNNTSYSYETPSTDNKDSVVFEPITKPQEKGSCLAMLLYFRDPTYYKSVIFFIANKFSIFIFWTFFPSYFYGRIHFLNLQVIIPIISCVGVGSLLFSIINICIKTRPNNTSMFLWFYGWMAALGFILIADSKSESPVVFGAIVVTFCTMAQQVLAIPLLKIKTKCENHGFLTIVNVFVGTSFTLFIIFNLSFRSCFHLAAFLQFIVGSLWLTNYAFKKIKNQRR